MPVLKPVIDGMLSIALANHNGNAQQYASMFINAVVAGCASAMVNVGGTPIPFAPAGMGGAISMIAALCSNPNGSASIAASQTASAIAMINPMVPPVMLSVLQMQLMNINNNSNNSNTASQIAEAVAGYYNNSGFII